MFSNGQGLGSGSLVEEVGGVWLTMNMLFI
jgi:hypothetical protein